MELPHILSNYNHFQKQYNNVSSLAQVEKLQQELSPYLLRRMKEDVTADIPAKIETILQVDLTRVQKIYSRALVYYCYSSLLGTHNLFSMKETEKFFIVVLTREIFPV